jgi:hypothetical protein
MGVNRREYVLGRLAITTTVDVSVDSEYPNRASAARGLKIGSIPSVVHQVWLVNKQFREEFVVYHRYSRASGDTTKCRIETRSAG